MGEHTHSGPPGQDRRLETTTVTQLSRLEAEAHRKFRLTPDARRTQIISEATRLIAASGFNAVSLADIASACGIRKPSVLHYFPTMHHLLAAVLESRDAHGFLNAGHSAFPAAEPQAVREWMTAIFLDSRSRPELVRLSHIVSAEALAPDHPAHTYFQQRAAKTREAARAMLGFTTDPAAAAAELIAFWQGLETEGLRDPSLDLPAVWETFCDRFFAP